MFTFPKVFGLATVISVASLYVWLAGAYVVLPIAVAVSALTLMILRWKETDFDLIVRPILWSIVGLVYTGLHIPAVGPRSKQDTWEACLLLLAGTVAGGVLGCALQEMNRRLIARKEPPSAQG